MGALGDAIIGAIQELLELLFSPITKLIEEQGQEILHLIVDTPHPNSVFSEPTNGPWPGIYDYYWDIWMPIVLFLWAAMIGVVIFFESTSYLFGSYHRSKLKRRAFSGLLGILSWWWLAALSLRFMDALTALIIPSLSNISLFETLSFTAMGTLGLVVSLSVDLILFLLIGIIYVMRQVVLYLFVLLMPLLIVFWIPGVGPFVLVSRFMQRLAGFFVPFLFMTVPVALLFRLGGILGSNFGLSLSGFGAWLLALIIPLVAVLSPFILVWQAGALFFMADRAMSHASSVRARNRVQSVQTRSQEARYGGRNFSRGLRGDAAVRPDGQMVINSGQSRAHAAGSRMRSAGAGIRGVVNSGDRGGGNSGNSGGNGGGGNSGGNSASGAGRSGGSTDGGGSDSTRNGSSDTPSERTTNFENLRGRHRSDSSPRQRTPPENDRRRDDERPWYIN
ncbi:MULTISPECIES: hypothetical protein [Salinibaculum]|uniref:hypothetical protein n=1 Tax=Salinibaculum TaxID=2732368 RepID=UPI0030CD7B2D